MLAVVVPLGACVRSVNPLYTEGTLVAEPALVGTWVGDGKEVLVITAPDTLAYGMTWVDTDGEASGWMGRVTMLGGQRWLDVEPAPPSEGWKEEYGDVFLSLHQFWLLHQVDSLLVASSLVYDTLEAVLTRDPGAVAHATVRGDLVLTADTEALRAFVAAAARQPGFEGERTVFRRVPSTR